MKARLLHPAQDPGASPAAPANAGDLCQDLELDVLLRSMAAGDEFLLGASRATLLAGLTEPEVIRYRQQILSDCLAHPAAIRELYDLTVEAVTGESQLFFSIFGSSAREPDAILRNSLQIMGFFTGMLRRLRGFAGTHAAGFTSTGFSRLFAMLTAELGDAYLSAAENHLKTLKLPRGVLLSAGLGPGNHAASYTLRSPQEEGWLKRVTGGDRSGYGFQIADRDEAGYRALAAIEGRGLNQVANALAQSCDHVRAFFTALRTELAFYIGCLNLHTQLTSRGEPVCFPDPAPPGGWELSARGLYDPCLSLSITGRCVGNDITAGGMRLVIVTGANQGGKSTLLRGLGLAQLMTQAGMFAPAESLRVTVRGGVFTHYKREEDATMRMGKLDEELSRMSGVIDQITPGCLLLCNESFASTNEREGSRIARQITRGLIEAGVQVVYVTHLYDLAHGFYRDQRDSALFLRAERRPDGRRTFRLTPGEPLPTSHGADLYRRVFGPAGQDGAEPGNEDQRGRQFAGEAKPGDGGQRRAQRRPGGHAAREPFDALDTGEQPWTEPARG